MEVVCVSFRALLLLGLHYSIYNIAHLFNYRPNNIYSILGILLLLSQCVHLFKVAAGKWELEIN